MNPRIQVIFGRNKGVKNILSKRLSIASRSARQSLFSDSIFATFAPFCGHLIPFTNPHRK